MLARAAAASPSLKNSQASAADGGVNKLEDGGRRGKKRLTFNAVAWKKKAPISRGMTKEGEGLGEGPLKKMLMFWSLYTQQVRAWCDPFCDR